MPVNLSHDDRGRGTAVVLLHGFPIDRRIWRYQLGALSAGMRVVTPDLRGFGQTGFGGGSFTLEDLADDVKALVDRLGLSRVIVGGLSMGGYVAEAFAERHPESLSGLILVDTKAEADTPDGKSGRDKMIGVAGEKGASAIADQMMPKMLAPETITRGHPVVAELRAMMEACPVPTIVAALAAMRDRTDRTPVLEALRVPLLVIVGEHDAIISPASARAMAKHAPVAAVHEVKGAGHMSPIESPADVNDAIRTFVKSIAVDL